MRREGTPAWMHAYRDVGVVERRLEQAAEVVEPCLERRPRNPVVYTIHSRIAGMTIHRHELNASIPQNLPSLYSPRRPFLGGIFQPARGTK